MDGSRAKNAALDVVRRLRAAGHVAVFAGGAVRDRLLGRDDGGDFDVATSAHPEEVRRLFPRHVAVGEQFGVVLVIADGAHVEVATFRSDDAYVDGRRPTGVRFTTPEEDASRRDFTINGMFWDPVEDRILDYVGGREDLARGVIRAIGDPRCRFEEDRLRLLRGVRFAARLGFTIDPPTAAAIREMAPGVHEVSRERVGEEIVRILAEGSSRRGFELLSETALLAEVMPEIEALRGVGQSPDYHPEGDVFTHTLLALGGLDASPVRAALRGAAGEGAGARLEALAFGVLLHDVAKPECRREEDGRTTFYGHCTRGAEVTLGIVRRLRRSNLVAERAAWLVRDHLRLLNAPSMRTSTLKRFLRQEGIDDLLELCRIDAMASNGDLRWVQFCRDALARFSGESMRPPPLLTGRDLIEELGLAPGPRFKEILTSVEEAQLEGAIATRDEALELVRRRFVERGAS